MRDKSFDVQDGKIVVKSKKQNTKNQITMPESISEVSKILTTEDFADSAFHGIMTEELRDDDLPQDQKLFIQ